MVLLGAALGYSLWHRHTPIHEAVATATAGVVSLVPEGLIVLISLTYAVASIRMARRGVLSQQLNAIESLASVDVICLDKTGTLTDAALRVAAASPADGVTDLERQLGRYGASSSLRNGTSWLSRPHDTPMWDASSGSLGRCGSRCAVSEGRRFGT